MMRRKNIGVRKTPLTQVYSDADGAPIPLPSAPTRKCGRLKKARHQCLQDGPAAGAPIALCPGSWDLCDSGPGEKCCQGEGVRVLPASAASPRASTKKGLSSRKKGQRTSPACPPTSKTGLKVPGLHIRASLKSTYGPWTSSAHGGRAFSRAVTLI